jgi:hypothetical protein
MFFVSDLFLDNYVGGAELTTEAILNGSSNALKKILSKDLTLDFINKNENEKWIFGNLTQVRPELLIPFFSRQLDYHMIEYDYKCCVHRIPEMHKRMTGVCCDKTTLGDLIYSFFYHSKTLWFMSEGQKNWYENTFTLLRQHKNSHVLSSVFDEQTIKTLASPNCSNKNNVYLIQEHPHPLKGTQQGIQYAKDNNLEYELFSKLPYEQVLEKFSQSRGFIFLPTEFDTCPRVTIEAKMLGCDVITNENVQHRDEEWFNGDSSSIVTHIKERLEFFWNTI